MKFDFSKIVWGSGFILVGSLMLLDRLDIIYFDFSDFVSQWWPIVLIFIGLDIIIDKNSKRSKHGQTGRE